MARSSSPWSVVVVFLVVMMMALSLLAEEPIPCSASGCCKESNKRPGPLDMTQSSMGYDAKQEGMKTFVYHCVQNFTSFVWYRVVHGKHVPVKDGGRFKFLSHNQTLQILDVKMEDAGNYSYVASNGTDEVTGVFHLQVDCRDVGPTFVTQEQPIQHVMLGAQKTLHCASDPGLCSEHIIPRNVYWQWWGDADQNPSFLKNGTLDMVDVVCDSGEPYGRNCSVHIHELQEIHYQGEFICRLMSTDLNQTIRLVPTEIIEVSWLPIILAVAAAVVMATVVVGFIWWRYGHRLSFWCRTLPDRDKFQHDAVVVYGEDHQDLARNQLRPRLRDLGYDVMEELARPGRPEVLEKAEAILSSYCVILTFSDEELQQGSARFLTDVGQLKSGSSVVFVRCRNYDNAGSERPQRGRDTQDTPNAPCHAEISGQEVTSNDIIAGEGSNSAAAERSTLVQKKTTTKKKKNSNNVWKDERMKAFKIVEWPRALSNKNEENLTVTEVRSVERFWCNLRKNLPRPAKSVGKTKTTSPSRTKSGKSRRDFSSTGSEQRLLRGRGSSTDRTSSVTSDYRTLSQPLRMPDVETGNPIREEEDPAFSTSPINHDNAACASLKQSGLGSPRQQPNATPANDVCNDEVNDVFIDVHAEGSESEHGDVFQDSRRPQHNAQRQDSAEDFQRHSGSDQDLPAAVRHYRDSSPEAYAQVQERSAAQHGASYPQIPQQPLQISVPGTQIPVGLSASPGNGDIMFSSGSGSPNGGAGGRPLLLAGPKGTLVSQESGYHSISPSTSPPHVTGLPPSQSPQPPQPPGSSPRSPQPLQPSQRPPQPLQSSQRPPQPLWSSSQLPQPLQSPPRVSCPQNV